VYFDVAAEYLVVAEDSREMEPVSGFGCRSIIPPIVLLLPGFFRSDLRRMPYPALDSQLFQQLQEPLHGSRASLPTVVEPAIDLRREGAPAVGSGSDWEAARGYVSLTSRRSHRREPTG